MRSAIAFVALCSLFACQKGKPKDDERDETGSVEVEADDQPQASEEEQPRKGLEVPPPDDVDAPPDDASKTESGVSYQILKTAKEDAEVVGENDLVTVHYDSWTEDGATVDSTRRRKRPMTFLLGTIPMRGFADGVTGMKVGEERRLWIPPDKAFQRNPKAREKMLVYDVEVMEVDHAPPTPEDVTAPPARAKESGDGVSYVILKKGKGKKPPRPWDEVTVHFSGWTTDGRMFLSTRVKKGEPKTFPANRNLEGVTAALTDMVPGEKRRVWIPEELAFKGKPSRPSGTVVYDLELLEIERMPDPPPAPDSVAGPPDGVEKTESGVSYKILREGKGSEHPGPVSRVTVHYTGWTTDGERFDSSIPRDEPVTFKLDSVIPGWQEGLQKMVEGDKARLWIPAELAYEGRPNRPQGMLVFDVELIEIK